MKPVPNDIILRQLQWRYATKKFDPTRQIPEADWKALEQVLLLTPSSFGLQPWKFLVITNPQIRQKLQPVSWHQTQITEASHLVVFTVKKQVGLVEIQKMIDRIVKIRGVAAASLDAYKNKMMGMLVNPAPGFDVRAWATRQVYIALGNFMTAAAFMGIDTCPIEGLDASQYDHILHLDKTDYATAVAAAVGYRSVEDKHATLAKVRYDHEEVIQHIK